MQGAKTNNLNLRILRLFDTEIKSIYEYKSSDCQILKLGIYTSGLLSGKKTGKSLATFGVSYCMTRASKSRSTVVKVHQLEVATATLP
jgi:hypothetical protein